MKCPLITDPASIDLFNKVVKIFDGKPLSIEEFKSETLRDIRTGRDLTAMNIAYNIWDISNGNPDMNRVTILRMIEMHQKGELTSVQFKALDKETYRKYNLYDEVNNRETRYYNTGGRQKSLDTVGRLSKEYPETKFKSIEHRTKGNRLYYNIEITETIKVEPNKNVVETNKDLTLFSPTIVKTGVQELFESNPELANIGTPEQYSQYLDTIFPNSKVKDIVYHGTKSKNRLEIFDDNQIGALDSGYFGRGFYMTPDFNYANNYIGDEGHVEYLLIDSQNPINVTMNDANTNINLNNNDSVIVTYGEDLLGLNDIEQNPNEVAEIVIKDSKQIHILGSKQDIEGFKDFVNQSYSSPTINKANYNKYQIANFTADQKNQIIGSLIYQFGKIYNEYDAEGNRVDSKDVIFNTIKNTIKDELKYWKDTENVIAEVDSDISRLSDEDQEYLLEVGVDSIDEVSNRIIYFQDILDNWGRFVEVTVDRLATLGFNSEDDVSLSEESNYEKTKFSDGARFTENPKDRASSAFKLFLSTIPDVKFNSEGKITLKRNFLGLNSYLPVDTIYDKLSMSMSDSGLTLNDLLLKLDSIKHTNPGLSAVHELLTKVPSNPAEADYIQKIQTNFVNTMAKIHGEKIALLHNKAKKGQYNLQPIRSNNLSDVDVIINNWIENQKLSKIVKEVDGELRIDKTYVKGIKDKYIKASESIDIKSDEFLKVFADTLQDLGITISRVNLKDLRDNAKKYFDSTWYTAVKLRFPIKNSDKFNESTGVMNRIFNAFLSELEEGEDEENMYSNNPLVGNKIEKATKSLAKYTAKYEDNVYALSYVDILNRLLYSIQNYTSDNSLMLKFKDVNDDLLRRMINTSLTKDSIWAQDLLSGNEFIKDVYKIYYADGLKKKFTRQLGRERQDLTPQEEHLMALGAFLNKGMDKALFIGITDADRSVTRVIQAPKIDSGVTVNNGNIDLSETSMDLLYSMVNAEATRIINFNNTVKAKLRDKGYTFGRYAEGADKFIMFNYLNRDVLEKTLTKTELDNIYDPDTKQLTILPEGVDTLKSIIKERTLKSIDDHYKMFIDDGIITETDGKVTSHLLDFSYLKSLNKNNNISKDITSKAKFAIADFVINYQVANMEYYRLFNGDPALNYKDNVSRTMEETQKRANKNESPFVVGNFATKYYDQVVINDIEVTSKHHNHYLKEFGIDSYKNIKSTDSFEYTTLKETIAFKLAYDKISKSMAESIMETYEKNKGGYYTFDKDQLKVLLQIDKPISVQTQVYEDYDLVSKVYIKSSSIPLIPQLTEGTSLDNLRVAMENSEIDRVAYTSAVKQGAINVAKVDDGKGNFLSAYEISNALENSVMSMSREFMGLQQEIPPNPKKTEITRISQMQVKMFEGLRHLPKFRKLEAEKEDILKELYEINKNGLLQNIGAKEVEPNTYEFTDATGKPSLVKLSEFLIKSGKKLNWTENDLEYLGLNEDGTKFIVNPTLTDMEDKIQYLLFAMIKNNIAKFNLPGQSDVQVPNAGIRTLVDLSLEDQSKMVFVDDYNPAKGLSYLTNESGKVEAAQIMIPFRFKDNKGKMLKLTDYTYKKDGKLYLDYTKLPKDALRMISARIPYQGHASGLPVRVVGFIPEMLGNIVVVPAEIVAQMGSDFDVDKLYSYLPPYYVSIDNKLNLISNESASELEKHINYLNVVEGNIEKLTAAKDKAYEKRKEAKDTKTKDIHREDIKKYEERLDEEYIELRKVRKVISSMDKVNRETILKARYFEIMWEVFTAEEVISKVLRSIDMKDLENEVNLLPKGSSEYSILDYNYQSKSFREQQTGKNLISLFALYSAINAIIENKDLRFQDMDLDKGEFIPREILFKNDNNNTYRLSNLSKQSFATFINNKGEKFDRSKIDMITILLNAAVDNANTPILGKLNLTNTTSGAALMMAMLSTEDGEGLDARYIARFFTQPTLKDFTYWHGKLTSSTSAYSQDPISDAITKVKAKYYKLLSQEDKAKVDAEGFKPVCPNAETLKELRDKEGADFNYQQYNIIEIFSKLQESFKTLNGSQKGFMIGYRNGAGTSMFEVKENMNILNQIENNKVAIENIERVIKNDDGSLTEIGYATYATVKLADSLFGTTLSYNDPIVNEIMKLISDYSKIDLKEDNFKEIWGELKKSILSGHSDILGIDIDATRKRFLVGKDSIARRIIDNKEKSWFKSNNFLRKIITDLNTISGDPDVIKYLSARGLRIDDNESNIEAIVELLRSDDEVARQLGEDIVMYSFITGGVRTINSFNKFLPFERIREIGIIDNLNKVNLKDGDSGVVVNVDTLIEQYYQHNPYRAMILPDEPGLYTIKQKNSKGTNVIIHMPKADLDGKTAGYVITNKEGKLAYPPYLSYRDTNNNKWILLKQVSDTTFHQIDTLGNRGVVEYNNTPNGTQRSLWSKNRTILQPVIPAESTTFIEKKIDNPLYIENNPNIIEFVKPTLQESLKSISVSGNPYFKEVANLLLKTKVDTTVNLSTTSKDRGQYSNSKIAVNPKKFYRGNKLGDITSNETQEVILHEGTHAILADRIRHMFNDDGSLKKDPTGDLNFKEKQAIRQLEDLRVIVEKVLANNALFKTALEKVVASRTEGKSFDSLAGKIYGVKDIHEFVAEVLNNKDFQDIINNIEYSETKTLFERFKDIIYNLIKAIGETFGIEVKDDSVLKESLMNIIELLDEQGLKEVNPLGGDINDTDDTQLTLFSPYTTGAENILRLDNVLAYRLSTLYNKLNDSKSPLVREKLYKEIEALREERRTLSQNEFSMDAIKFVANRQLDLADNVSSRKQVGFMEVKNALDLALVWKFDNSKDYLRDYQLEDTNDPMNELLRTTGARAEGIIEKLMGIARELIIDNSKNYTEQPLKLSEINNINDVGFAVQQTLDASMSGVRMLQVMDTILKNTISNSNTMLRNLSTNQDKYLEALPKQYRKNFDWMIEEHTKTNKDGTTSNVKEIISPFSTAWYKLQGMETRTLKKALTYQKEGNKLMASAMFKKYYKSKSTNGITIDLRYFDDPTYKKEMYVDGEVKAIDQVEYKKFLQEILGKELAEEMLGEAKNRYERYIEELAKVTHEINDAEDIEDKDQAIQEWKLRNSPLVYMRNLDGYNKINDFGIENRSQKYVVSVPRKYKAGNLTPYYNSKFEFLLRPENKSLYDYYKFYRDTISKTLQFLPYDVTKYKYDNFLPVVAANVMEVYLANGMQGVYHKMGEGLRDSITGVDYASLSGKKVEKVGTLDINNKPVKEIPIQYMNNIEGERSFNVPKLLEMFAGMAINYKFKTDIEDQILLMNRLLQEAKELSKDPQDRNILDRFNHVIHIKGGSLRAKEMGNYLVDALMYDQKRAEEKESKTVIRPFDPFKKVTVIDKNEKTGEITTKRISARRAAKRLEDKRDELNREFEAGTMSEEVLEDKMKPLEAEYRELGGKNLVVSKVFEKAMIFNQLKGMGYNITAGIANMGFGVMSNINHAYGKVDYTPKECTKAFGVMLSSMKHMNVESKAMKLVQKLNILFEITEIEYGKKSKNKSIKMLSGLSPYEIQRRTEYFIQGMSMVAQMMYIKVIDKNGKERTLWDAYDKNGDWKVEEFGDPGEWSDDVTSTTVNKFTKFRGHVIQVNKLLHGNYDTNSPILGKKALLGRMLFQYRSWIPAGFAQRFQNERYDDQLGRTTKGRYRSFASIGIMETIRTTFKGLIGLKSAYDNIDKAVDVENMRKNVAEMKIALALYALGIILRAGLDDDDDDTLMNYPARILLNQLWRVESDIYFYFSPATFKQIIKDPIPIIKLYTDFEKAISGSYNYIMDEDYEGESPYIKWMKAIPFLTQIPKTKYLATTDINK